MIKSFRGKLEDGAQETIRLGTNQGLMGYKIVKFQLFPYKPGWSDFESLVQIWKYPQTGIPTTEARTKFDDQALLGAALFTATAATAPTSIVTVFDNETFNQDIYVTHTQQTGAELINYYIELEQIKLDLNEATVATLKDMRGSN